MAIKLNSKNRFLGVLIILIIILSLPIINLDRNIRFSCTSVEEENKIVLKCFVEPYDARFINEKTEIGLNQRSDFLPKKNYTVKVSKVDNPISYYNGIAYRPIYCEVPEGTFDEVGIILDGAINIDRISTFKLILVSILNWLEPYSGEKIILH